MKKLLEYCKPYRFYLFVTVAVKVLGTLMDLIIPYLLGYILDEVVPNCTKDRLAPVFYWGSGMVLCAVIALLSNIHANRRTAKFSKDVVHKIRGDLFEKILSLSAAQTDSFTVPSLVARMSSDSYAIHAMLNVFFRGGFRAVILLVGGIVVTLVIEPVLALTFVVLSPLMALAVTVISRKGIRLFKQKQIRVDAMVEKVRDSFSGIRVIKALSKIPYEKEAFGKLNLELSRSEERANITMGLSQPIINIFLNLGMTAVVALGAVRVAAGHSTPGQIISFMSYFTIIHNATLAMTRVFTASSRGAASADRIQEVLEEKPDLTVRGTAESDESAPFLEFRNVTFSYRNKKRPALKNISFTLEKGQTLGILGGTGSGKSTLVQLLLRFYDPKEGEILLEGVNLKDIPTKTLREYFGVVFQNDFLMADTLKENILFGRDLSEEDLVLAAKSAQALPFIRDLEQGFDHTLSAGGKGLSGGQRQRVLVARALAGKTPLLILDDSSSALDYKTDALLRGAIDKNYSDRTAVIVAQRISSVKDADLILVLEEGEMIGKGDHATLSQTCEVYREIQESQMGEAVTL